MPSNWLSVPHFRQEHEYSCVAACVRMVLAHFGETRAEDALRALLDTRPTGTRGWVQTLFGRRRYLEGLHSPNGATRSFNERVAINTPIQGSAADLMKLAMTRVHAALKASVPSARLLLQVHDELLLECAAEDVDAAAQTMRTEMESCVSLRVPLEVSVGRGATWLDVH